ncbi:hypothetical protein ZOSMA_162G00420 [Zostera marina]|uniref:Helicase C-terminal domain-containing protein n=1 Tax=Zostera marina TaxID=29655 RepID=A0A0K9PU69_ZOSMR|nr:hypothetical protein ZOSMA_162G00420 [Zostera marina]
MSKKIQNFASSLVKPMTVNVRKAGAANLDVIQEVEYVKQEAKIVHLLECLQKTPPPVLMFCENKTDVDDIHEYLLLKGAEGISIHGGNDQKEREHAISSCGGLGVFNYVQNLNIAIAGSIREEKSEMTEKALY